MQHEAVVAHRRWMMGTPAECMRARRELRGKVLGCWCRPQFECHGDTLMSVANSTASQLTEMVATAECTEAWREWAEQQAGGDSDAQAVAAAMFAPTVGSEAAASAQHAEAQEQEMRPVGIGVRSDAGADGAAKDAVAQPVTSNAGGHAGHGQAEVQWAVVAADEETRCRECSKHITPQELLLQSKVTRGSRAAAGWHLACVPTSVMQRVRRASAAAWTGMHAAGDEDVRERMLAASQPQRAGRAAARRARMERREAEFNILDAMLRDFTLDEDVQKFIDD